MEEFNEAQMGCLWTAATKFTSNGLQSRIAGDANWLVDYLNFKEKQHYKIFHLINV